MEKWIAVLQLYPRSPNVRAVTKVLDTANVVIKQNLAEFEIEWFLQTLFNKPVLILKLMSDYNNDDAWCVVLGKCFELLSTLVADHHQYMDAYFDAIVKTCMKPYNALLRRRALHVIELVAQFGKAEAMTEVLSIAIDSLNGSDGVYVRQSFATLVGKICEHRPELLTEDKVTEAWRKYLCVLEASKISDNLKNGVLQGLHGLFRNFGQELPTAELNNFYKSLVNEYLHIKGCHDACFKILTDHSNLFPEKISEDAKLRQHLWSLLKEGSKAGDSLRAVYSVAANPDNVESIVNAEIYTRTHSPQPIERNVSCRIMTVLAHNFHDQLKNVAQMFQKQTLNISTRLQNKLDVMPLFDDDTDYDQDLMNLMEEDGERRSRRVGRVSSKTSGQRGSHAKTTKPGDTEQTSGLTGQIGQTQAGSKAQDSLSKYSRQRGQSGGSSHQQGHIGFQISGSSLTKVEKKQRVSGKNPLGPDHRASRENSGQKEQTGKGSKGYQDRRLIGEKGNVKNAQRESVSSGQKDQTHGLKTLPTKGQNTQQSPGLLPGKTLGDKAQKGEGRSKIGTTQVGDSTLQGPAKLGRQTSKLGLQKGKNMTGDKLSQTTRQLPKPGPDQMKEGVAGKQAQRAVGQKSQISGQRNQETLSQKTKSSQEGQRAGITSQQTGQMQQKNGQQAAGDTAQRIGQKTQEISSQNKPLGTYTAKPVKTAQGARPGTQQVASQQGATQQQTGDGKGQSGLKGQEIGTQPGDGRAGQSGFKGQQKRTQPGHTELQTGDIKGQATGQSGLKGQQKPTQLGYTRQQTGDERREATGQPSLKGQQKGQNLELTQGQKGQPVHVRKSQQTEEKGTQPTTGLKMQLDTGQLQERGQVVSAKLKGQQNRQEKLGLEDHSGLTAQKGLGDAAQATRQKQQDSKTQASKKRGDVASNAKAVNSADADLVKQQKLVGAGSSARSKKDQETSKSAEKQSPTSTIKSPTEKSQGSPSRRSGTGKAAMGKNRKPASFRKSNRISQNQPEEEPVVETVRPLGVAFARPLCGIAQTSVSSTDQHQYSRSERRKKRAAFACAQQHQAPFGPLNPCYFMDDGPPC